jgi:hypothetical protein
MTPITRITVTVELDQDALHSLRDLVRFVSRTVAGKPTGERDKAKVLRQAEQWNGRLLAWEEIRFRRTG